MMILRRSPKKNLKIRIERRTQFKSRYFLENLIFAQLFKKLFTIYGARMFITVFTTAPLTPILSRMNPTRNII
jgi:hypothetical protein